MSAVTDVASARRLTTPAEALLQYMREEDILGKKWTFECKSRPSERGGEQIDRTAAADCVGGCKAGRQASPFLSVRSSFLPLGSYLNGVDPLAS